MERKATVSRETKETQIQITLNLDGKGRVSVDTGVGFFDHMLNSFGKHGLFDLEVKAKGDLYVDCHHLVEDTGIGIPNKDKVQVFQRFYRVDKSRSKEVGGTGLGLSIVKHIALYHGGKVYAEDRALGGTRMVAELPK